MQVLNESWLAVAASGSTAFHHQPQPWWQRALIGLRAPVWPAILATLTLLGLLLAFQQVVLQAVQQGEARRRAAAASDDAVWRCKALRDPRQRESCRAQLNVTRDIDQRPANTNDAMSMAVVQVGR